MGIWEKLSGPIGFFIGPLCQPGRTWDSLKLRSTFFRYLKVEAGAKTKQELKSEKGKH
jgi:hypothetical protein